MNWVKLLALVPPIGIILGAFVANRVTPYVFGMPFLLFYIVAWVVLTAPILAIVYKYDPANKKGDVE